MGIIAPVRADYQDIRHRIRTGDAFAFRGEGAVPGTIAWKTGCDVTHFGGAVVSSLSPGVGSTPFDGSVVRCFESTSLDGSDGVREPRMSELVAQYRGRIWWLPLADPVRDRLDLPAMLDWLYRQRGKKYDFRQAILSGLDRFDSWPGFNTHTVEDFAKIFCSELWWEAYERGGILPARNASEMVPHDLVERPLWGPVYYQLTGETLPVHCFRPWE